MAHLADPEDMKMFTKAQTSTKVTHKGRPVKPMLWRKSAPPMASRVPILLQLNSPWNWPQKKQNTT